MRMLSVNFRRTSEVKAPESDRQSFSLVAHIDRLRVDRRVLSGGALVVVSLLAVLFGRLLAARPVFVLGFTVGAILLVLLSVRPKFAVAFIMVYTPFEEFVLKFVPFQAYALARYLPELLLFATLALVIIGKSVRRESVRRWPTDLPLLVFVGISLVSVFYNRIPLLVGVLELRILLRYVVAFYIFLHAGFERRFIERLFKVMLGILAIQVSLGLLQSVMGNNLASFLAPRDVVIGDIFVRRGFFQQVSSHTRIFATMGRYNHYGNFLAFFLLFPISLLYLRGNEPLGLEKKRVALLIAAGLTALMLSFSRMSWLGFYAGLVVMLLTLKKRRITYYLIAPIVLTLVLSWLYGPEEAHDVSETIEANVFDRYLGMFSRRYVESSLSGDRLYALTKTTNRVLEISPFLGLGPGSVASAAAKVFGGGERWEVLDLPMRKVVALGDVGWAAILAQYGILGIAAFLWLLKRLFTSSLGSFRRARDSLEKALCMGFLGGLACVLVENIFSFNFTYRASSLYFWVFAGIVARLGQIQQDEERTHRDESAPVQHVSL